MAGSINIGAALEDEGATNAAPSRPALHDVPLNRVYERVGEVVLAAAEDGVRRGRKSEDIIRDIVINHDVRLSLGDFRLLLASRRASQ